MPIERTVVVTIPDLGLTSDQVRSLEKKFAAAVTEVGGSTDAARSAAKRFHFHFTIKIDGGND